MKNTWSTIGGLIAIKSCVNATAWRGIPANSVRLTAINSNRGKFYRTIECKFEIRDQTFSLLATDRDGVSMLKFQVYRSVDFKYALRAIRKRGIRDIRFHFSQPKYIIHEAEQC